MNIRNKTHFLYMDLLRCVVSSKIVIGILGVISVLLFATANILNIAQSVLSTTSIVAKTVPFLIVLSFCAIPYAGSICEDLEYRYVHTQTIRGNLVKYTLSKIMVIFFSSIITLLFGMFLYILILRSHMPWITTEELTNHYLVHSSIIVRQGHYLTYFLLFAIQFGLIAGVLSLLGTYISLYISNKLFIYTIPLMVYSFMIDLCHLFFPEKTSLDFIAIFNPISLNIWKNDLLSFLWALWIAILFVFLLTIAIYKKLKRRLGGE